MSISMSVITDGTTSSTSSTGSLEQSSAAAYTNAHALRAGLTPCETDPARGGLSRTPDLFHAPAAVTVGSQRGGRRHVCEQCADKWHKGQARVGGVRWD